MARLYDEDAELYDIAFDWDVEEEVDWLLERLGAPCRSVLEPGCGTGRMLVALARRGVEAVGLDLSERALEIARRRLEPFGERARVVLADMTDFALRRTFDGAICPINTLGHLSPDGLARHLACVARHLAGGRRYLVQVGLMTEEAHRDAQPSVWEAERGATRVRTTWADEWVDFDRGVGLARSRLEVLAGPRAGTVVEDTHEITVWTPETWRRAIASSPFSEEATYDAGRRGERPVVGPEATGGLLWHELTFEAAASSS